MRNCFVTFYFLITETLFALQESTDPLLLFIHADNLIRLNKVTYQRFTTGWYLKKMLKYELVNVFSLSVKSCVFEEKYLSSVTSWTFY